MITKANNIDDTRVFGEALAHALGGAAETGIPDRIRQVLSKVRPTTDAAIEEELKHRGMAITICDNNPLLLMMMKINTNSFAPSLAPFTDDSHVRYFYAVGSFFRHSCFPNCKWTVEKGLMRIQSIAAIAVDEECTISFVGDFRSFAVDTRARQAYLKTAAHFACTCALCSGTVRPTYDEFASRLVRNVYTDDIDEAGLLTQFCSWCGAAAETKPFKVCEGTCKGHKPRYCSQPCQCAHWVQHQRECTFTL